MAHAKPKIERGLRPTRHAQWTLLGKEVPRAPSAYSIRGPGVGQGAGFPDQQHGAAGRPRGIVAQLSRAIMVGPIARLELIPFDDNQPADNSVMDAVIEAQIPAQQFRDLGLREGETLVVTPRRACVFVEGH